ncbi:MAG: flagellar basal body-associated FliL family protein [Janthinobacterium lividum]
MSAKPAAPAATAATATAKPKGKKTLLVTVLAVVLLAGGGAGAWFFLGKQGHADDHAEVAAAEPSKDAKPSFLALDNMIVNLADPGGERVAQIGITLELESEKSVERIKLMQPKIRSGLLLLVSQRTSSEVLGRDGKEKLATDVMDEVSRVLGYEVEAPMPRKAAKVAKTDDEEEEAPVRRKSRRAVAPSPVLGVLFSSFIVQ